jgi:hypothetical protein
MNIPGDPFSRKRPSLSAFLCTPARAINQRTGAAGQLRLHRKLARVSACHPWQTLAEQGSDPRLGLIEPVGAH